MISAAEIMESGDEMVAEASGLEPEQLQMLCLTALGPGGATLWESSLVALSPAREPRRSERG